MSRNLNVQWKRMRMAKLPDTGLILQKVMVKEEIIENSSKAPSSDSACRNKENCIFSSSRDNEQRKTRKMAVRAEDIL